MVATDCVSYESKPAIMLFGQLFILGSFRLSECLTIIESDGLNLYLAYIYICSISEGRRSNLYGNTCRKSVDRDMFVIRKNILLKEKKV